MPHKSFQRAHRETVARCDQFSRAVRLDPKFTLAYCASAEAQDLLYSWYDPTPERRASADAAINTELTLQIDLPEVHLAYALVLDLAAELSIWVVI